MLIKRQNLMTFGTQSVKKMTATSLAVLTLSATAIAPTAVAGDTQTVDKIVKVKIKLSELQTQKGTQETYSKIKKRAKRFCNADRHSLAYFGETRQECTSDLVEQFIQNSDIEKLKAYHTVQKNS